MLMIILYCRYSIIRIKIVKRYIERFIIVVYRLQESLIDYIGRDRFSIWDV